MTSYALLAKYVIVNTLILTIETVRYLRLVAKNFWLYMRNFPKICTAFIDPVAISK